MRIAEHMRSLRTGNRWDGRKEKNMAKIDDLIKERDEKVKMVERMGYDPNGGAGQAHSNRVVYRLLLQIEDLNAEIHRLKG